MLGFFFPGAAIAAKPLEAGAVPAAQAAGGAA
jgi:hypothetical protein